MRDVVPVSEQFQLRRRADPLIEARDSSARPLRALDLLIEEFAYAPCGVSVCSRVTSATSLASAVSVRQGVPKKLRDSIWRLP
jgi:hypothetical protein